MRVILVVALVGLTSGCVSQDRFRKKEAEAEQLKARSAELEASLASSRSDLDMERQKSHVLQGKVDELSKSKTTLETAKVALEKKSTEYEKMATALRGQIEAGRIELTELRGKMTVKMKDKILFSSGSAKLGKEGQEALRAVAEVLSGVKDKVIRVEGHTDNVPRGRSPFATNWELSASRALAVVRFLQECGVDPTRLAGAGYGEYHPIAPNDTPEGRSLNRRIEIVLAAGDVAEAEAPPAPPKQ